MPQPRRPTHSPPPRPYTPSTDSMPELQSAFDSSESLNTSSSEDSSQTSSSEDVALYDTELRYPSSPSPDAAATILPPHESPLESPPISPGSLQNLPGTTPLLETSSQRPLLAHFAQAALSTAERALRSFSLSLSPSHTEESRIMRELEERVCDLERASSTTPTPRRLPDTLTRLPVDEDFEARMEASDRLAHALADHLRDPQVYRLQVDTAAINTSLLLAPLFMEKAALVPEKGYAYRTPETPPSSPTLSPTSTGSSTSSLDESLGKVALLTDEEQRVMEDIFDFLSEDGPGTPQRQELEAAETLCNMNRPSARRGHHSDLGPPAYEAVPDMFAPMQDGVEAPISPVSAILSLPLAPPVPQHEPIDSDEPTQPKWYDFQAMETSPEPTYGAPPSRRPTRNDCGIVTYNRRQFGWHDYQYGIPPWPRAQRDRSEVIGYALEFPDRLRFHHTDRRLRLEAAQRASRFQIIPHYQNKLIEDEYPDARRHPRLLEYTDPELPEFILDDLGDDASDTDSDMSLPDELAGASESSASYLRYYENVEKEHAYRTTLAPITRTPRHSPTSMSVSPMLPDSAIADGMPAPKRQKTRDTSLTRRVLCAEALNATLQHWEPHMEHLQYIRSDVAFTIQRIIEVIQWLGLAGDFRHIFFPFTESFPISTVFQIYAMERMHNPDGFFRRNPYHLNSLLHDSECNFLQACAILFRQTGDYELAYAVEELLSTSFRDDTGVPLGMTNDASWACNAPIDWDSRVIPAEAGLRDLLVFH
ncbi:hypothetical protein FB451DRAFT_1407227 [Mycena latifolia]|nr:hypothetical protein FB451DRAFT_1407227 [Mycena latifolia]